MCSGSVHESYVQLPGRQDSGYVSARGSVSKESSKAAENLNTYGEHRPSYNGSNPPPPPPPPPRHMRRQMDGALDSPPSDGSGRGYSVPGINPYDVRNGVRQGTSPLTPTSAEGVTSESTILRERKNGKKPEPLRQVDDTLKSKRRQPQVADAYRYVEFLLCIDQH
jgi:hypothetical protein